MYIDQISDKKLAAISHLVNDGDRSKLQGWLKQNAPVDPEQYAIKTGSGFYFPVNDPLNILLSWSYLGKCASDMDYETAKSATKKILSNAKMYGMDLVGINKDADLSGYVNEAMSKTSGILYALKKQGQDFYPLRNENEVKTAILYFEKNYKSLDPIDRRQYAKNAEKVAENFKVNAGRLIRKYASDNVSEHAASAIETRTHYISDPEVKESYKALSSEFGNISSKMAVAALYDLDKTAGIDRLWDKEIKDPVSSIYTEDEKTAEEALVDSNSGSIYEKELKTALRKGALDDMLDQDTVKLLGEHPKEVISELPDQMVEAIAQRLAV